MDAIHAAYGISGAVDEDHRQLRQLEEQTAQAQQQLQPMLSQLSGDIARQALVLATAGYTEAALTASGHHQAMAAVMLGDRIAGRATSAQFVVFGGSVSRGSDPDGWATLRTEHLARARDLGRSI